MRTPLVEDAELLERLSCVFRDVGYEGASLVMLAKAAGLGKASLYHRFPGGKEQMARESIGAAVAWLEANILAPLRAAGAPQARLQTAIAGLDRFYSGGEQSCLLNLMSSPHPDKGPFAREIKAAFDAMIAAFAAVARDAGAGASEAHARAERVVMLVQGSLVVSRGRQDNQPFKTMLAMLPAELLGAAHEAAIAD